MHVCVPLLPGRDLLPPLPGVLEPRPPAPGLRGLGLAAPGQPLGEDDVALLALLHRPRGRRPRVRSRQGTVHKLRAFLPIINIFAIDQLNRLILSIG